MGRHRLHLGRLSTISRDERGVAIAIVLMVGMALVLISSVVVARGFRQMVNTNNDTNWGHALFAAEAGLDEGLVLLEGDMLYTTGEEMPLSALGTEAERTWAVATVDARDAEDLADVSDGQYALVRPSNANVLFAVGYAPSRAADERRVRTVRVTIEWVSWTFTLEHALLVGDDVELSGNTTINDTNENDGASVHANGTVSEVGGSATVEGCLTDSNSDRVATAACPASPLPLEAVPLVDPLVLYPYSHYVLCDDGEIYGGPVNATDPDVDDIPCNGNETSVALAGWSSQLFGGVWKWSTQSSATTDAVIYIQNGNFDGKVGSNPGHREVTLIVASGSAGACTAPSTGHINLGGNSNFSVHPSMTALGWDIAAVAQGDIDFQGGSSVGGAIFAHEQMDYIGNADSWGAVVASEICDTIGSPLSESSLSGASTINYPGPMSTPFTASTMRVDVVGWYEL